MSARSCAAPRLAPRLALDARLGRPTRRVGSRVGAGAPSSSRGVLLPRRVFAGGSGAPRLRARVAPSLAPRRPRAGPAPWRAVVAPPSGGGGGSPASSSSDESDPDGESGPSAEKLKDLARDVNVAARASLMKSTPQGEEAEAIRAKMETYGSLDDIVLDFAPEMGVAEKLLLIGAYFNTSPAEVAARLAEVTAVFAAGYAAWTWEETTGVPAERRSRGDKVRDGVASLGPVFVKMAQTLSTRPDIIGDEAADALKPLQDEMDPFSSEQAYGQIREELGFDGPIHPGDESWRKQNPGNTSGPPRALYKTLSPTPVAAASIGQVYKGTLWDDREVAVKVQRPGVLRQIALDLHIARIALIWLEESGINGSTDLANIVDRVGQGIFQELDYTREAKNADDFRMSLRFMDFLVVPRHEKALTGRRVLTQEWINGRPMKSLTEEEQLKMVQWGVECSSAQLFRTGLVHADPHEGNMLYTDDGKLALLDFGLICRVNNEQQEAMAGCILNILNRDWMDLIDNLRIIEMLPKVPQTWVDADGNPASYTGGEGSWKDVDDRTFRDAFQKCMDGDDPDKSRTNFTELVVDLTKLSTAWRFNLPPYMVFIIRSLTTLDFCAVRTGANMYELAAPTALFRAMAPKTPRGRAQLKKILMNEEGGVKWQELMDLAESAQGSKGESSGEGVGGAASDGAASRAAPASPSAMDKHTRASVNRLVSELVGSSSGSALRRILVAASPESLIPPSAVRDLLVKATRETFARSVAELTPAAFLGLIARAVSGFFRAVAGVVAEGGKRRGKTPGSRRRDYDAFPEGSVDAFECRTNLEKRRIEIAKLMVKSKLSAPLGFVSAGFMLFLLGWAAITGAALGATRGIRLGLIKMLGGAGFEKGRGGTPKDA